MSDQGGQNPSDLLSILIDIKTTLARSEGKIDALGEQVRQLNSKHDDHETRIRSIESAIVQVKAAARTSMTWVKVLWAGLALIGAVLWWSANQWVVNVAREAVAGNR